MTYPTAMQVTALYEMHEEMVQYLTQEPVITASDLEGLHKNILSRLASDFWGKISAEGRSFLLSHTHHFVRSPAVIGDRLLTKALARDVAVLSIEEAHMRYSDLKRRAAELAQNGLAQATVLVPGSKANTDMVTINVDLAMVRARLTTLGQPETPQHYVWI